MNQSNDKHCLRWKRGVRLLLPSLISFFALAACSDSNSGKENPYNKPHRPSAPVTVTGIGPVEGGLGTKVVVNGENFGNDPSKVTLYFNDKKALILNLQDNAIYAMVPRQPGEYSTIKVDVDGEEGILGGMQFKYHIRATVTTVAGVWMENPTPYIDGPALESTFWPVQLGVDDEGNILVAELAQFKLRLISTKDNKVTTVFPMTMTWKCAFNPQFSHCYVMERSLIARPILFHRLSKESDYTESVSYYDQRDEENNWVFGSYHGCGLALDDTYVYMLSEDGTRFVRVHQEDRTVELIGKDLPLNMYSFLTYNQADGMIYMSVQSSGRIVRFDPYHTPAGRTTPWITWDDMEWIVGTGTASTTASSEGNGRSAQLGFVSGLCADFDGNIYVSDGTFHCIWKIDPLLNCTVFAGPPAGPPVSGYKDGKPEEALFNLPQDVAVSPDGILYVADQNNNLIRAISVQ